MADRTTFTDGNDVCAGCGRCCRNVIGLLVTEEELARVPMMGPHVTGRRGPWQVVDMPEGCPYQLADGRCGVYGDRPYDCSLYPVHVSGVRVGAPRRGRPYRTEVSWRFGGDECPQLRHFKREGVSPAQLDSLEAWSARSLGVVHVRLRRDRLPARPRRLARTLLGGQPPPPDWPETGS